MRKILCKFFIVLSLEKLAYKIWPSEYIKIRFSKSICIFNKSLEEAAAAMNQLTARIRAYSEEVSNND